MFFMKRAAARIAAGIRSGLLGGLEKLKNSNARRVIRDLKLAIHEEIATKRTRGAFGQVYASTRYRSRPGAANGAGLWRRNAATGKVRGY